jgi:hypothetical protein
VPRKYTLVGGKGEVSGVGVGGDVIGPFKTNKDGVIEVPDDFLEAIRVLDNAAGVVPVDDPDPDGNQKGS